MDRDYIKNLLASKIVEVTFNKKDGSTRTMSCTLQEKYLPKANKEAPSKKKENLESLSVWDIEKNAWRSFRLNSIVYYSIK